MSGFPLGRANTTAADESKSTATVSTTLGTSDPIRMASYAGGAFIVPSGVTATSLTWYVSHNGVNFAPLFNEAGDAAVSTTIAASRSYPFPRDTFGAPWIKALANSGGNFEMFTMISA